MIKELNQIVARNQMQAPAEDVGYMRPILREQTPKVNKPATPTPRLRGISIVKT